MLSLSFLDLRVAKLNFVHAESLILHLMLHGLDPFLKFDGFLGLNLSIAESSRMWGTRG